MDLVSEANRHIRDILLFAFEYSVSQAAVVVFDTRCELAVVLTQAYRSCLPSATFIDFDSLPPEAILAAFEPLRPKDLVVLIQSTNFRLEAFRIRVELFKRSLKVIEHPHLSRMQGEDASLYVESLAYDPDYYRGIGSA